MTKVLQATSRGQVTLPKKWRDQFNTKYFISKVEGNSLIITPLLEDDLKDTVEESWEQYQEGKFLTAEQMKEKYGL